MNQIKIITSLFILNVLILISACEENLNVGYNLLPSSDSVHIYVTDTFTISARTIHDTILKTDEPTYALIGTMNDPIFGKTQASFVTGIRPYTYSIDFGSSARLLNNAQLRLAYDTTGYFPKITGDATTEQEFIIYELTDSLYLSQDYYSDSFLSENSYKPIDRIIITPDTSQKQLVLELSELFSYTFFNTLIQNTTDQTLTDPLLGLYLTTSNIDVGGALYYFKPLDTASRLSLHIERQIADVIDTLRIDFRITQYDARYNLFAHDYSETIFEDTNQNPSSNEFFVQGASGLVSELTFPFLNDFKQNDKTYIVNKAELILQMQAPQGESYFAPPVNLGISGINEFGDKYDIQEYLQNYSGSLFYLGEPFDPLTLQYRFILPIFIQKVIDGELNPKLKIYSLNGKYDAGRAIFNGNNIDNGLKLVLTYTILQ